MGLSDTIWVFIKRLRVDILLFDKKNRGIVTLIALIGRDVCLRETMVTGG